jgi:hypothetical protein
MDRQSIRTWQYHLPILALAIAIVADFCPLAWGQPASTTAPAENAGRSAVSTPRIDTAFIAPDADIVFVIRPAQIVASPNAAILPLELAAAMGPQHLGFDPAVIEEVVGFIKMPGEGAESMQHAVTVKLNQPFQGSDIPENLRLHTQPAQLAGRNYLQSKEPGQPSLFAPNNRTLILSPDATLRALVEPTTSPAPGRLFQRVRTARSGNDLYVAAQMDSFRPMAGMALAMAQSRLPVPILPDEAQPAQTMERTERDESDEGAEPAPPARLEDLPSLISVVELTLNVSDAGPCAFVLHATDEEAGRKIETMVVEAMKAQRDALSAEVEELSKAGSPATLGLARYRHRITNDLFRFARPRRAGSSLVFFRPEGGPNQRQLINALVGGLLAGLASPATPQLVQSALGQGSVPEGATLFGPASSDTMMPAGDARMMNDEWMGREREVPGEGRIDTMSGRDVRGMDPGQMQNQEDQRRGEMDAASGRRGETPDESSNRETPDSGRRDR